MGGFITDLSQSFIRVFDNRRALVGTHRLYHVTHIRYEIRIVNNYLLCFLRIKI